MKESKGIHLCELLPNTAHVLPTYECVNALGLVVPVNTQEVNRDASKHYGQANSTHNGLRVQTEKQEEGPEEQVNDGPHQADLETQDNTLN